MSTGRYSFVSQFISLGLSDSIVNRLQGRRNYDDLEDALLYSRLTHEQTHLMQNVATTYGLWKTSILRLAAIQAWTSMDLYRKRIGIVIQPFDDLIPRGEIIKPDKTDPFWYGAFAKILRNWVSYVDGPIVVPVEHPNLHIAQVTLPKGGTHVHCVDPTGIHAILAGQELIEFQARSSEIGCLNSTKGIVQTQRDEIIPTIWADPTSQVALRTSDAAFGFRTHESWRASLAMTEIALNGEWPVPGILYLQPMVWEDIHPGWRFSRMCELIRKKKLKVPIGTKALVEFQHELCQSMGWLPPVKAFENMIVSLHHSSARTIIDSILQISSRVLGLLKTKQKLLSDWYIDAELRALILPASYGPIKHVPSKSVMFAAFLDAALQLFMSDEMFCPVCLSENHEPNCQIHRMIDNLTSNGLGGQQ